jgi:hypothetical protein
MQVLEIGPATGTEGSNEQTFYEEFVSMLNRGVKVFNTWCHAAGNYDVGYFEFVTGSKDVHLALGEIGENGRINLAFILETWFKKHPYGEVLFQVRVKDGETEKIRGAMLVTRMVDGDRNVTFHCSPAR